MKKYMVEAHVVIDVEAEGEVDAISRASDQLKELSPDDFQYDVERDVGEQGALDALKKRGMSDEEAEDFLAGVKRGVKALREGERIPWSVVKRQLGIKDEKDN